MTLVIDSPNLLHRVYWTSQKQPLINSRGEDTSCEFKFLRSVFMLAQQFRPTQIYTAWDKREETAAKSYRWIATDGTYKAGRDTSAKKLIYSHNDKIVKVLTLLGVKNFFPKVLEADDIIAWLAKKFKEKETVIIASCDHDFFQLIEPNVQVYNPVTKQSYNISNFSKLLGVKPEEYLTYKALTGDVADNLHHVELSGIGPKTAIRVIKGEKTLTDAQEEAMWEQKELMSLEEGFKKHPEDEIFYTEQYSAQKDLHPDFETFRKYCTYKEFNSILKNFDTWKIAFGTNKLFDLISSLK